MRFITFIIVAIASVFSYRLLVDVLPTINSTKLQQTTLFVAFFGSMLVLIGIKAIVSRSISFSIETHTENSARNWGIVFSVTGVILIVFAIAELFGYR